VAKQKNSSPRHDPTPRGDASLILSRGQKDFKIIRVTWGLRESAVLYSLGDLNMRILIISII
jgi:hypothetical protein